MTEHIMGALDRIERIAGDERFASLLRDLVVLVGVALVGYGVGAIYAPAAWITVGAAALYLALWHPHMVALVHRIRPRKE
jgi:hypothetical protein